MPVEIKNLKYVYMKGSPFEKTALNDINIKIDDGAFIGIIGHTGSGKSTLIQHLNGLLRPTEGCVIVNGMEVSGKNVREIRKNVGLVFQYPEHQLFEDTVYNDIGYGLIKQGIEEETLKQQINKTIELIGLDREILDRSPLNYPEGKKEKLH